MSQLSEATTAEVQELLDERRTLAEQKTALVAQLTELNFKMGVRVSDVKYAALRRQRHQIVIQLQQVDKVLNQNKLKRQQLNPQTFSISDKKTLVAELRAIRDKYQDIAAGEFDAHGPSERMLASQVVRDLNPLMRKLIHE